MKTDFTTAQPEGGRGFARFTTVLLDVDGTLLDFNEAERLGVCAVMRAWGMKPTSYLIERYHQINQEFWKAFERGDIAREEIFGNRYVKFFASMGKAVDGTACEILYREQLDNCAILIDGAEDICAYLKDKGYDLYIVTNGVSTTQYSRLKRSGLDRYFTDIFVSEDSGSQKPKKEYFDYCFARIREKDPARMLIVGDSQTSDIRGGMNAGVAACWLNDGTQPRVAGVRADYEIRGLGELRGIL